jgi:hypothetical protein
VKVEREGRARRRANRSSRPSFQASPELQLRLTILTITPFRTSLSHHLYSHTRLTMFKSLRNKISRSKTPRNSAGTTQAGLADNARANARVNPGSPSFGDTAAKLDVQPLTGKDANTDHRHATGSPAVLRTAAAEDDESHTSQHSDSEINQSISCEGAIKMLPEMMHTGSLLLVRRKGANFRVLCIDGGGYCCLSAILTLTHLLGTVDYGKYDASPRLCEHVDLICGVGSGGLVAILFAEGNQVIKPLILSRRFYNYFATGEGAVQSRRLGKYLASPSSEAYNNPGRSRTARTIRKIEEVLSALGSSLFAHPCSLRSHSLSFWCSSVRG